MAIENASKDENNVSTLLGVSSADGTSPVKIYADPTTHRLLVDVGADLSVTLADVSANSLTTPNSLYTMTATIPVEFMASDATTLMYLSDTTKWIGVGTSSTNFTGFSANHRGITVRGIGAAAGHVELTTGTAVLTDDAFLGSINFGNATTTVARVLAKTDGTAGTSGELVFFTTNAGSSAERLRINTRGTMVGSADAGQPDFSTTVGSGAFRVKGVGRENNSLTFEIQAARAHTTQNGVDVLGSNATFTGTSSTIYGMNIASPTFVPSGAGSANFRPFGINYTINNAAGAQSGTATGLFLNATETSLNGMAHNLMDLQVDGSSRFLVNRAAGTTTTSGIASGGFYSFNVANSSTFQTTSVTQGLLNITGTLASPAGSGSFRPVNIEYTINNSGAQTGTATGLFLNATETSLNGMTHRLMDLQVGGTSQYRVSNTGASVQLNTAQAPDVRTNTVWSISGSNISLRNSAFTDFGLLQFGGTTSSFPALKRSGATLQVRLADDSAYARMDGAGYHSLGAPIQALGSTFDTSYNSGFAIGNSGLAVTSGTYRGFYDNRTISASTGGTYNSFENSFSFAPTSGTTVFNGFNFSPTINQTGGANGITRGLYINPTLTAAADFRAIDVVTGITKLATYTFGTLPTGIPVGAEVNISDSNTTTWGATIAGGGSDNVKARWNGTVWTVVGI